jgi:hypothetical protein
MRIEIVPLLWFPKKSNGQEVAPCWMVKASQVRYCCLASVGTLPTSLAWSLTGGVEYIMHEQRPITNHYCWVFWMPVRHQQFKGDSDHPVTRIASACATCTQKWIRCHYVWTPQFSITRVAQIISTATFLLLLLYLAINLTLCKWHMLPPWGSTSLAKLCTSTLRDVR